MVTDHEHHKDQFLHLFSVSLNRRVEVEGILWDVASGTRGPIEADEARSLAIKLGVPSEWLDLQFTIPEPRP